MYYQNRNRQSQFRHVTENDVMQYLNEYFIDFKRNLKNNNVINMDINLVTVVAEKFAELFELWDENIILRKSIDKQVFENIHKLMCGTFDDDKATSSYKDMEACDFSLECNHCGENFELRNDDVRYSYDIHTTSKVHKELIESFNERDRHKAAIVEAPRENEQLFVFSRCCVCHCNLTYGDVVFEENLDVFTELVLNHIKTPLHRSKTAIFYDNKRFISKNVCSDVFTCEVCLESFCSTELLPHFESDLHKSNLNLYDGSIAGVEYQFLIHPEYFDLKLRLQMSEIERNEVVELETKPAPKQVESARNKKNAISNSNFISKFDAKCIVFRNKSPRCMICNFKFNNELILINHFNGSSHRQALEIYKLNADFMVIDNGKIYCTLCNLNYVKVETFFKHCDKSAEHNMKFKRLPKRINPLRFSICQQVADEFLCFKCQTYFCDLKSLLLHFHTDHVKDKTKKKV